MILGLHFPPGVILSLSQMKKRVNEGRLGLKNYLKLLQVCVRVGGWGGRRERGGEGSGVSMYFSACRRLSNPFTSG